MCGSLKYTTKVTFYFIHVLLVKICQPLYQVVIAAGFHLFPFRTEKLSPPAQMVLQFVGEYVIAFF